MAEQCAWMSITTLNRELVPIDHDIEQVGDLVQMLIQDEEALESEISTVATNLINPLSGEEREICLCVASGTWCAV